MFRSSGLFLSEVRLVCEGLAAPEDEISGGGLAIDGAKQLSYLAAMI
jgi:hypothetical protein